MVVDGARISWALGGAQWGRPVLFVHGGSAHGGWWDAVIARLAVDHACAAVDLSGHGHSDWRDDYAFDQWVREVTAVADAQFPDGCTLVGHSLGGAVVCAAVTAGHPARAVVAVDTNGSGPGLHRPPPPPPGPPRMFATRAEAEAAVIARKGSWVPEIAAAVAASSVREAADGWRMHADPAIRAIAVPGRDLADLAPTSTLLLAGTASPFRDLFEDTRRQLPALPHVRIQKVPGAGHDIMMEHPDAVADAVRRHVADLPD